MPFNPQKTEPNCTFPSFDQLNAAQQALLGKDGASAYGSLSNAQRANFLNLTGALGRVGINFSGLSLQQGGIHTDRLLFAPGSGLADLRSSVAAGISNKTFIQDKPIGREHPGMSDWGARQSVTTNALQIGGGRLGAFVDIDRGGSRTDVAGFLIHMGELITPGSTDPFAVGRGLGSGVTGYSCR